ncbi:MAG: hypothetical protein JWO06_3611, partial [Bacteroidota bacterium]|nr:hypothetical protein [Bacteroidota bacterium]
RIDGNPDLHCLPQLNGMVNFSFTGTGITCLPNYGRVSGTTLPNIHSVPLCTSGNLNGCQASTVIANAGNSTIICAGASVQLGANPTAAGGTPPYTYQWAPSTGLNDPSLANPLATPTSTTTFAVTVTDNTGAQSVDTMIVGVRGPAIHFNTTNTTCFGDSTGSLCATATGGTLPYAYQWTGNLTTACLNNLAAGSYTITITDAMGCGASNTGVVGQPTQVTGSFTSQPGTCGQCNGQVSLAVSGGVAPYLYSLWYNNIVICTALGCSNLCVGSYVDTVKDANGCKLPIDFTISATPAITQTDSIVNPSCSGVFDGQIIVNASGGTPPLSYSINGGTPQSSYVFTGLSPQWYEVDVTDNGGCYHRDTVILTDSYTLTGSIVSETGLKCYGDLNDTITVNLIGGIPPYQYSVNGITWQPTPVFEGLGAGSYAFVERDSHGCMAYVTDTVIQPSPLSDSLIATNELCFGGQTASICGYPIGGTSPYALLWSNFSVGPCATSLTAGKYYVDITDLNGCLTLDSALVFEPAQLTDSISVTNVSCYGANNGSVCFYVSGGQFPYTYVWAPNNAFLPCDTNLAAGSYVVTITDFNGCSITASSIVTEPAAITYTTVVTQGPLHFGQEDTIVINITGGAPPVNITWQDTSLGIVNHCDTYWFTLTDANSCSITDSVVVTGCVFDSVWPGDANYDGIVDNNDLLPIGIAYGDTGSFRLNPTNNWIGQYCHDWTLTQLNGANYKHIDCNGSGEVEATDTLAIIQNYSLTHTRSGGMDEWRSGIPQLKITMLPDTLVDSQLVVVTLSLGDSNNIASNVYGLAFTFNYDELVVDTNSVNITFGNSWLCNAGDHMAINKNFGTTGKLQAAVTRVDHANRTGYGDIATVDMKITAGNINGKDLLYYTMKCFINNLTVIDSAGNHLAFNAGNDSAHISYFATAISEAGNDDAFVKIFPNPAYDQLTVNSSSTIRTISIANILGETVLSGFEVNAMHSALNISGLSAGTYVLNLQTDNGQYRKKFIKIK